MGEADRILTVFSKHEGKFSVRAKGIRRIPSRRSAHVELLNHSILTLYEGRFMPILTEAESLENFQNVKDDFSKVGFAYHLCELINGLCPDGQEHQDIFQLLKETLSRLSLCHSDPFDSSQGKLHKESLNTSFLDPSAKPQDDRVVSLSEIIHEFEIELLTILGYWKKDPAKQNTNTTAFIEDILERRLKSRKIFNKISNFEE